jgi:hypothetical protein
MFNIIGFILSMNNIQPINKLIEYKMQMYLQTGYGRCLLLLLQVSTENQKNKDIEYRYISDRGQ